MSPMYLSQVELSDFRTFGKFVLDVAPGPGLTLLIGSNGLGKSSFFDAIEWCLTGRVQRLEDYAGRLRESSYLTRRDAPVNAHRVALTFDQAHGVTRSGSTAPDANSILRLLKSDGWAPIVDLSAYLNFTHFLGQASQQRFTSRKSRDQWESLKAPSGIDRLEAIRSALRGRTTSAAFVKRIEHEGAAVLAAERALADWRKLRDRLDHLLAMARATGDVTTEAIEGALVDLEGAVRAVGLARHASVVVERATQVADVSRAASIVERQAARLASARASIDDGLQAVADRRSDVERLSVMASRYRDLPSGTGGEAALAAAEQTVSAATAAVSQSTLATGEAERVVKAESLAASEAFARARRLSEAGEVRDEVERLRAERSAAEDGLARLTGEVLEAQAAAALARDLASRRQERAALELRRSRAEELVSRARDLETSNREVDALRAEAERATRTAEEAKAAVMPLRSKVAELRDRIAEGQQAIRTLQRRAGEMAEALATVAKHLDEHDEACPVCSTSFPHGVLKRLAATAAASDDAALAERAELNEALEAELETVLNAIATGEGRGLARGETSLALARAETSRTERRVGLAADLRASAEDDLLAAALDEFKGIRRSLLAAEDLPSVPGADLDEAEVRLATVASRAREGADMVAMIGSAIKAGEARLLELGAPDKSASDMASLAEAEHQLGAQARARQGVAEAAHAAALAAEAAARRRLGATIGETERVRVALAEAQRERDHLQARWGDAGLAGAPSGQAVSAYVEQLAAEEAALQAISATATRLGTALRDFAAETELGALRSEMVEFAGEEGTADPVVYEALLLRKLDDARGALLTTEQVQAGVRAYSEELKGAADAFSTQFLMPLNDLIGEYNKALLNAPGETVQFAATHAVDRTNLSMRLRYADRLDDSRYDTGLSPYLVMSEGQLAANGLSILCAASTAYPWSKWRALLLDDPLQHNDIVHASAFVDVMRNLVERRGYQILMSTHDRAEGEFMSRKFDAAGLACTTATLTAPSRNGVRFEPSRYNAAALAMMNDGLAATA